MNRSNYLFIIPAILIIILDQLSKLAIIRNIGLYDSIPVIKGLFNLVHLRNKGMAFGIMNGDKVGVGFYVLSAAAILAVALLIYWYTTLKEKEKGLTIGLSLILGGAIGNLIDRIRLKEVVDFLDFHIGSHHWPSFNIADSAIMIGTIWVVVNILFFTKQNNQ